MRHTLRLSLMALLSTPIAALAHAEPLTPAYAKKCEHFAGMTKLNMPSDSDEYSKIHDIQVQWRKLAVLIADEDTDLEAEMSSARSAFWDIGRNGNAAEKQAFNQSLQSCATPPNLAETVMPADNCARLARFIEQYADSTRQSWEGRVIQLANSGAEPAKVDEAKQELKSHNENVKRALTVERAGRGDLASRYIKADSLGIFDNSVRAALLETCIGTLERE